MNEFKLPKSLRDDEKEILLSQLQNLIEQTYSVEKEYVALTNSYNQLQSLIKQIIEALPNALWVINKDGSIFLQNSEAEALDGLFHILPLKLEEAEVAFDGRYFLIKSTHNDEKKIISATDITEQKRKERLASMGQMAAHLAHEIRNPIGSIALLASSLTKRVLPKNQPIVNEIRRSLFRVERIIKTTLMYSKGIQPHLSKISLERLKKECQVAVESYSYTKEICFHYDFPPFEIEADLSLLSLALQNLLFNAIDAIEEDESDTGDVWIKTNIQENQIVFIIEDSGIALENPKRLFEAFQTTKTKGHGLGLALSRQIIEAHGGKLEVQIKPKQFKITLPFSKLKS